MANEEFTSWVETQLILESSRLLFSLLCGCISRGPLHLLRVPLSLIATRGVQQHIIKHLLCARPCQLLQERVNGNPLCPPQSFLTLVGRSRFPGGKLGFMVCHAMGEV